MTTSRKWSLGTAVVVVLILVATWFLLVSPKRGDAAALETQTQGQEDTNSQLQVQLSTLQEQNKDLPKYQAQLAALREQVPQSNEMPGFIRQLTQAADSSGVFLQSLEPATAVSLSKDGVPPTAISPEGALPPELLAGLDVKIVVYGGFYEIQQFTNKLEKLQRYTLVAGLNIGPLDASQLDNLDDVEARGSEDLLTGTFSGRIYLLPPTPEVVPTEAVTPPTTTPQS
ncbi:MAG TPA: type 4a pilus biogenesis protein PilO [Actinomycetes bacterium]|nr:type 4a pilus biogenesis protein PilO [Actinomycetes bacterium]